MWGFSNGGYGYQTGGTNASCLSWTYGSSYNSIPTSWNKPLYGG